LEELAVPYYLFKEAGAQITLASPKGGEVPLDPRSESIIVSNSTTKRFLKDQEGMHLLNHSVQVGAQHAEDFNFVLLLGGHGSMWDFVDNPTLKTLLEHFNQRHQWIGAVGHGVAGLLSVTNRMGALLAKNRQLTASSNSEEQILGSTQLIPFLLESKLIELGAAYTKGTDFLSHVIVDGTIITGQNSASAKAVAKGLLSTPKESPRHIVQSGLPVNN